MARTLIFVSILLSFGLATRVSQAQLFRGNAAPPAAREPARVGLLGGLREAREERFRREEQAAAATRAAATRAAAAQRNAAIAPRSNPNAAPQQPANIAGNDALRRGSAATTLPPNSQAKTNPNARSANFRGPSGTTPIRGQESLSAANSKINPNNALSRPTPANSSAAVTPASATSFVPEPVGYDDQEYDGPGVVIRLPKEAVSVVNFLVDETNTSAIRPGEQQVLDTKGSYVVRYSRGVTRDGRSFGESRYTITEGRYRFELTATGWELYREGDAETNLPRNEIETVENTNADPSELLSSQSELQRTPTQKTENLEAIANKPAVEPAVRNPTVVEPAPASNAPAANEEVLPAPKPRSILE